MCTSRRKKKNSLISVFGTGIKKTIDLLEEYNEAILAVKPLTMLLDNDALLVSDEMIQAISTSLAKYSNANKIAAINSLKLNDHLKKQILTDLGLSNETGKLTVGTTLLGKAQAKLSNIASGLKTVFTALGNVIAGHPILAIGTVLATAVAGVALYQHNAMNEALDAASEGAQAYGEISSSINDYADRYKALHDEIVDANTTEERQFEIKQELYELQKQLNSKYGDEYGKVNLVTQAYKDQTNAILNYQKVAANNFLTDNRKGIIKATEEMTKIRQYTGLGSTGYMDEDYAKEIYDIASKYQDRGLSLEEYIDDTGKSRFLLGLESDAEGAERVLHEFAADIRNLGAEYEDNNVINGILANIEYYLNINKKILDKYQDKYDPALMAQIVTDPTGILSDGFNKATKAVENYNEALVSGNDEDIQKAYEDLTKVKNSIDLTSDTWLPYKYIMSDIFKEADTGLLDLQQDLTNSSTEIGKISDQIKKSQTETGTPLTRTDLLSKINSSSNDKSDPYAQLKKSTKGYGILVEDIVDQMVKLGIIEEDFSKNLDNAFQPLSKEKVIENINGLSEGFESLDKIMSSMKGETPFDYALFEDKKFKETFSGLGDEYTNFIDTISSNPKDLKTAQNAFNELATAWIKDNGALNGLSDGTANVAEAMLSLMGVSNAAEVVGNALADSKAEAITATYGLIDAETEEAVAFVNTVMASDEAKEAVARYTLAKLTANGLALLTNGDIENVRSLVVALDGGITALDAYNKARQGMIDLMKTSPAYKAALDPTSFNVSKMTFEQAVWESQNRDAINAQREEYANTVKEAEDSITDLLNKPVSYNSSTKTNTPGSNKKEKEPRTKDFDWISRRQELLQKQHDQEQEMADDESVSYQTRIALIDNLIAKDKERLAFNEQVAESYNKAWEDAKAKLLEEAAKQGKNGDEIITSIKEGNTVNDPFTDELADAVQAAADVYDDLTANEEKLAEINKESNKHLKQQLDLKLSIAQAQTDLVKAQEDSLSAEIDLMEAQGMAVSEEQLKKQISLSEDLADSYNDQIDALYNKLAKAEPDSAEYHSILSEIFQCEAAISQCAVQQAEWNDQIKRLPIERINKFLELLGYIKEDLQNFINEQNSLGKDTSMQQFQELININLKQIEKLLEQQEKLSELLSDYEYGSTKYQETASDLQSIDNQISDLIQSQNEWNQSILQIPINTISNLNETLQNAVSAMSEVLSDYDTAISSVTSILDKQIDTINDLKDTTTDEYEAKIKPYQDELDLLQKQNEAKRQQLDLEQAKYDFEQATSQKTNQVNKIAYFYSNVKYVSSYIG